MSRSSVVVEEVRSNRVPRPPTWAGCASRSWLQVLLVDDEIDQLLPLADVLRHAGMAPTIATSVDEVLFEVEMSSPDVVVLDADMADRGLLSQLRALISTLPVVLMNSGARHDAMWGAMLATVGVACIDKPVDARKLIDLLSDSSRFTRCSATRAR
jgi:DNA-binding NtrC family response regulator